MSIPIIPIRVAKDVEPMRSWEGISTPHDLALYMARILSIDGSKIMQLQEVVYSDLEPTGEDRKRLWVKTSEPVGYGIPTGDNYTVIYKYPAGVPILWVNSLSPAPSYMRKLTDLELGNYSLTDPVDRDFYWVIFNP